MRRGRRLSARRRAAAQASRSEVAGGKHFARGSMTSGAEPGIQDKPFMAAVHRCATQKQIRLSEASETQAEELFRNNPKPRLEHRILSAE